LQGFPVAGVSCCISKLESGSGFPAKQRRANPAVRRFGRLVSGGMDSRNAAIDILF
jgi:hypothetical protein